MSSNEQLREKLEACGWTPDRALQQLRDSNPPDPDLVKSESFGRGLRLGWSAHEKRDPRGHPWEGMSADAVYTEAGIDPTHLTAREQNAIEFGFLIGAAFRANKLRELGLVDVVCASPGTSDDV